MPIFMDTPVIWIGTLVLGCINNGRQSPFVNNVADYTSETIAVDASGTRPRLD